MRPLVIVFLSGFVFLVTHVSGQAPKQPPAKKEDPPYKRVLTEAEAKRVAALQKKVLELKAAGKLADALAAARQIVTIRTRAQGAKHWQTTDARIIAETLKLYAGFSPEERTELGTAVKSSAEARQLDAQRRFARAEPLYRKALAINRKLLGGKHHATAINLNDLAQNLDAQAKYVAAEPLFRQALAICRQALGEEHWDTAIGYHGVARNLSLQGKHDQAEPFYRKALAAGRQVLGEDHLFMLDSYLALADNLDAQGKSAQADPLHRQALAVCRRVLGEDHTRTVGCYEALAHNLAGRENHVAAEPLLRKALAINLQARGEVHLETAASYHNLAGNLFVQGKLAEAESLVEKALAIKLRVVGRGHPRTANSYRQLALIFSARRKYAKAEPLFQKALAIHRRVHGENSLQTASSYNNLALNFGLQAKYAQAEPLLRKALAINRQVSGRNASSTAYAESCLANNLHEQGKYAEAEQLAAAAERRFEADRLHSAFTGRERVAFGGLKSPPSLLPALLARNRKPGEAWRHLEASLARGLLDDLSARRSGSGTPDERRQAQHLVSQIHLLDKQITALLGAKDAGEKHRDKAAQLQKQRDRLQDRLIDFEANLARKYGPAAGQVYGLKDIQPHLPREAALVAWLDRQGMPKAADPNGEHWACIVRQRGEPVWVKLPGSGPKGAWTDADNKLGIEVRQMFANQPRDVTAKWRDRASQLYRQRLAPLAPHLAAGSGLPALQHLIILPSDSLAGIPIEALVVARTDQQPAYTVSYAPSGTIFAWLQEQRQKALAEKQRPTRLLALGDPTFPSAEKPKKLPEPPDHGVLLTQIQPKSNAARAGLQAGDVLLRYGDTKLTALADLAAALKKSSSNPRGTEPDLPVAVWRHGRTLKVKVFPGPLGVVPSRQAAAEAIRAAREAEDLLRRSRGPMFQPLPGTRREVQAIAKLFTKADQLLGSDASEERLNRLAEDGKLKGYHFLHLATHGAANPKEPLLSYLALAQDKLPDPLKQVLDGKQAYTGQLTAAHIQTTWKLDADLVTLSACQTGLGKYEHGEGYLGFAQGLFLAGARSLVLSQWSVDDDATALLMVRFYENLLGSRKGTKPLPKAKALQQAKDWLRNLSREEAKKQVATLRRGETVRPRKLPVAAKPFAHPYYWAGFILVGDPH
jgi:CHAT domain-containing protein